MKRLNLTALCLLLTCLSFAQTNHLVISQVYGGGGGAGATYKNDFIEIYNPTSATVTLTGLSVQYASSGGTFNLAVALTGTLAPGQYYLVAGPTTTGTNDLPVTPNVSSSSLSMSATSAKVALVNGTAALGVDCSTPNANIIDLIGYGTSASCAEGTRTGNLSTANAAVRKNNGCTDTDNNLNDFSITAPGPRNLASTTSFCPASGCAPTNGPSNLTLTPDQTFVTGSFTAAAAGTSASAGYLVLASTSANLSELPLANVIYNVGDDLGNAQVVAYGNSTSFTASGLSSNTPYYFFVYSYSAGGCYQTGSPARNSTTTLTPPPCTPPATQASNAVFSGISSSGATLTVQRGTGTNMLVVYKANNTVDAVPTNGTSYTAGDQIGSGNFVAYTGSQNMVTWAGLYPNTLYHVSVFEYNTATNCYTTPALTSSFTTACGTPSPVTSLSATAGNGQITLTWNLPLSTSANGACYDELFVLASASTITADASAFSGASANSQFSGTGVQLVYKGGATSTTITGLTNGTTYYFRVYSRQGTNYTPVSSAPEVAAQPFDPSAGYNYLFGNLHAHSSYSDGNKSNPTATPKDDYEYARDAQCMDFLGISEHNHTGAGMSYSDYARGFSQAAQVNGVSNISGNSILALWGMEWGVSSSGGGHVLLYGFDDQLVGWEAGTYDIFCAKNDYSSLWTLINSRANAFGALAHPGTSDFGSLLGTYNSNADNAVVGVAVESGPALTDATDYNTKPSSLSFLSYYKNMLAAGYRVAPQMDQDNHYMTFGTINRNRMVVLAGEKTKTSLVDAIRSMRFYASQDCNARLEFKSGTSAMGSTVIKAGLPTLSVSVTDLTPNPTTNPAVPESVATIELWGGQAGNGTSALLKSWNGQSSVSFTAADAENVQANNTTWYYFLIVTQTDGDKMVSAPIWYSRNDQLLPVTMVHFKASYKKSSGTVMLHWTTAQETGSKDFLIQRSVNGGQTWETLGSTAAAGTSSIWRQYSFEDVQPASGWNLYRLIQRDLDGSARYSSIVSVTAGEKGLSFSLNPNPARGYALLTTTAAGPLPAAVVISDAGGRKVYDKQHNLSQSQPARIDLAGINPGIYFVQIRIEGHAFTTQKLLVY